MGTKKNYLEELRKVKGCTLSQGQIAIKVGTSRYNISKFENKTTYSWDVLSYFRYCHATKLEPGDVFATLYPEEPYALDYLQKLKGVNMITEEKLQDEVGVFTSDELFEKLSDNNDGQRPILPKECYEWLSPMLLSDKFTLQEIDLEGNIRMMERPRHLDKDTIVIGSPVTEKGFLHITPAIISAMSEEKNVFAIVERCDLEKIRNYAKETGHEVVVAGYPYNEIDWFSSIREPDSIGMFAATLSHMPNVECGEYFRDSFVCAIVLLSRNYLWSPEVWGDESRQTIQELIKHIQGLPKEKMAEIINQTGIIGDTSMMIYLIKKALSDIAPDMEEVKCKLTDAFRKKHVILYVTQDSMTESPVPALALQQYMRILDNVKGWGEGEGRWGKDHRQYAVIIDPLADIAYVGQKAISEWISSEKQNEVNFLFTLTSVEQVKDAFPSHWKKLLDKIPAIHVPIFPQWMVSDGTEQYLAERYQGMLRCLAKRMKRGRKTDQDKAFMAAVDVMLDEQTYAEVYLDEEMEEPALLCYAEPSSENGESDSESRGE